jgi:hypothetical protein
MTALNLQAHDLPADCHSALVSSRQRAWESADHATKRDRAGESDQAD